jgi:ABC-type multidrug transport system ATPase subunit
MVNVMRPPAGEPVGSTEPPTGAAHAPGVRVDVVAVDRHAGARQILHGVSLTVEPGELVAVAGRSGAGKSTLLEIIGGMRRPSVGRVLHDGWPAATGGGVGYVPQDDIIHRELPLRRTLRYAAALRLPRGSSLAVIDRVVDETLHDLDLADRADVRVGALSGGQRKRACIAVELLTRPHLLLLDEPTSGLDPSTAAEVLGVLRRLAGSGVTVVLTTHAPPDIDACDRVVFLARDGHLAFAGTPAAARAHFGVADLAHAYRRLPARVTSMRPVDGSTAVDPETAPAAAVPRRLPPPRRRPQRTGAVRQWSLLARRSAEVMVRNRLTLAVLLGSPLLVTAMFAVLFRPGAFDAAETGSLGPAQTVFWIAFAGFFFGLTYGLLQIVGEMAVLRRERLAGLRVGAYVVAKVTVLAPVLALVAVALLGVLRLLDRLPAAGWTTYAALFAVLVAESVAALTLGLLASAVVADAAQATLALPMLCFPQVLFAGAVVPVADMAGPGQVISAGMANRWAFESLGRSLDLDALTGQLPALAAYEPAFAGSAIAGVAVLAGTAALCGLATVLVLHCRTRP